MGRRLLCAAPGAGPERSRWLDIASRVLYVQLTRRGQPFACDGQRLVIAGKCSDRMTSQIIDAPLSWQAVAAIADGAQLSLSQAALARIAHAKAVVSAFVERRLRCYGVTTGVAALADVLVDESRQSALSHNVLMSHACGIGAALSVPET